MYALLTTALALMAGLLMTRVFKLFHVNFPDVTSYLLAGLLVGPFALGRLGIRGLGFTSFEEIEALSLLKNAALGFIAFSIGSEFKVSDLKTIGKQAFVIGVFQAVIAAVIVDVFLIILHFILGDAVLPVSVCITLGAIASATAPAATLMVVRQYKAHGPLTKLLLPIVALDDAVGLVVFAVSFGIAQALEGGSLNFFSVALNPLLEIIGSLLLGALMGWLLSQLEKLFFSNSNRLSLVISFVLLTIALSALTFHLGPVTISFSSLLVCMMLGTVFCNLSEYSDDMFKRSDKWTVPLLCTFFVISGAELDLSVFAKPAMILVGVVYILVRSLGKYMGARWSSGWMKCSRKVHEYLGITLLPQAGVALGMVVTASSLGGEEAAIIRNVVLFAVLVYEIVGPSLTKWALARAGEITETPAEKKTRERFKTPA